MSDFIEKFNKYRDRHVIIEASAGTGKTYAIEQIVPQLIEAGTSIDKIAVLTFTEKAAAELQDRIRKGLTKRIENKTLEEETRIKLEEALEFLPNASIGTIHHFCRSLIKKYSLKLGLSAKFGEIKNVREEIEIYFKKFWGKIEKDDSEDLIKLLQRVEFSKFKETLIQLTEKSGGKKIKLLPEVNLETTEKKFQKLKSLVANCNLTKGSQQYLEKLILFDETNFTDNEKRLESIKKTFLTGDLEPIKAVKKFILESNSIPDNEYDELIKDLREKWEEEISIKLLNPIFIYANQLIEEFEKHLIRQDKISLDGLILKARSLVYDQELRAKIQKDTNYLILDECQDTNPIQIDLVTKLFENMKSGIIFVGDPKQSIYRFRNADLESYNTAVKSLNSKYELRLDTSYRSSYELIDVFNSIFPKFESFKDNLYQAVKSNRPQNNEKSPPLLLLGLDSENNPKYMDTLGNPYSAETLRKEVIEDIINLIHTIVGNKKYLIAGIDKVSYREINFSDIAILANSNTSLTVLLREFSRKSISANIYKSQTFYSHKIVQAISHLLHAIENPNDSSSLYKTLASDLFLIPESILYRLSDANELSYLFDTDFEEVNVIYESLRKAHENRYVKDAAYTMLEVLRENRILEIISMGFEGKRNLANIYHLSEILSVTQASENLSFGETVRNLKRDVENSIEQEIKLDNDKKDDSFNSVQLMTMHASKGLEFPVCILYDLAASPVPDRTSLFINDSLLLEDELSIEIKLKLSTDLEIATSKFEDKFSRNTKELKNERERLLYVGFTRAKDYLVLPLHFIEKQKNNSLRKLIDNAFSKNDIQSYLEKNLAENFIAGKDKNEAERKINVPMKKGNEKFKIQLSTLTQKDINNKAGIKIQSYSSIARYFKEEEIEEESVKERVAIEKNAMTENEEGSAVTLSAEKRGTTFGLLCHAVMENFNLKYLSDENRIEDEVKFLVNEYYPATGLNEISNYSSKEAIEYCKLTLTKSYPMDETGTTFSKIKDWRYLVREKSFFYKLKSSKMDYLIGIGDGMFFWNNKYYLLDWKTNLVSYSENETLEAVIQKKVKDSYFFQYMIYSMNLLENITFGKEDKKTIWDKNFGGMLFIFMRVKEDKKGSVLVKPSYEEVLQFKKGLEN